MNIEVTRINHGAETDPSGFVRAVNEDYYYQLKKITDEIIKTKDERPVILLSGPSGSGKTTTALMIEKILTESGCETHTLSMDNYFCPLSKEEKELASLGKMDLESPLRIDKDLLNTQIEAISRCEEVAIPYYDFAESARVARFKGRNDKRKRHPESRNGVRDKLREGSSNSSTHKNLPGAGCGNANCDGTFANGSGFQCSATRLWRTRRVHARRQRQALQRRRKELLVRNHLGRRQESRNSPHAREARLRSFAPCAHQVLQLRIGRFKAGRN